MHLEISKKNVDSAVLVLHELCSDSLILTKRSPTLASHPGEVCFPGGMYDSQDESLLATAFREVYEELGIDAARINVLKPMAAVKTRFDIMIHPWFATIHTIEPFVINPDEVSCIIKVPWVLVQSEANYHQVSVDIKGKEFYLDEFIGYTDAYIWGATARIMKQCISHQV